MKKRLTAWLLVFCMALSLLPGTAFAASGGGDGTITVYYDLNDNGKSPYLLKMETTPGQEPPINPGAVWAGRPFAGWAGDRAGSKAAEFKDGAILYAQWQSGYEVSLCFNTGSSEPPTSPATYIAYTTDNNGKLKERDLAAIDKTITDTEALGRYTFEGWYVADDKGDYKAGDLFTKALTTDTVISDNGLKLYAKWETIYQIHFDYDMDGKLLPPGLTSGQSNPPIETTTGGILSAMPKTPAFKDDGFDFEAWYILEPNGVELPGSGFITLGQLGVADASGQYPRGVRISHEDLNKFSFTEIAKKLTESGNTPIKLVANWQLPAGIVFHANGGHFGSDETNYKEVIKTNNDGDCIRLPATPPTLTGYEFLGWYRSDAFNSTATPPGKDSKVDTANNNKVAIGDRFSGPETVYAAWEKLWKVTIKYGTGSKDPVILYVKDGEQLSTEDYENYVRDIDVPGYTVGDKWFVYPDSTGIPSDPNMEIKQIQTYKFTADTTIEANLIDGYRITFWTVDKDGNQVKFGDPQYTNTEGYLMKDNLPATDPTYPDGSKSFKGWATKDGAALPPAIFDNKECYGPFTGAQDVYAQWGAPFKITFDPNGGTVTPTEDFTDDNGKIIVAKLPKPTSPTTGTYAGYEFEGWHLKQDLSDDPVSLATPACTEPTTLYAKWVKPIEAINITYILTDGSIIKDNNEVNFTIDSSLGQDKTTLAGTYPNVLPIPTATNTLVQFQGWYTTNNRTGTRIYGGESIVDNRNGGTNIYLFAKWGMGATYSTLNRPSNTTPSTFAATRPSTDVPSLTAVLPNGEFQIDLETGGGTLLDGTAVTSPVTTQNKCLSASDLPTLTKGDGYKFIGWFSEENGGIEIKPNMELDRTVSKIYARWEFLITFLPNGGHFPDAPTAFSKEFPTTGSRLTTWPDDPVRDGYDFVGWMDQSNAIITDKNRTFTGPEDLKAEWKKSEYTITFDRNDGTGILTTRPVGPDGKVADVDSLKPTLKDHVFEGWYTASDGGEEVTSNTTFIQSTTIYAHWRKLPVVTFDPDNGDKVQVITADENGKLTSSPDNPQYAGRKFEGWFTAKNGGGNKYDPATDTFQKDATYYAYWTTEECTITWDTGHTDASPTNPSTITEPSKTVNGYIPNLPQLTRKGYRFNGWVVKTYTGGNLAVGETVTTGTPIYADIELSADWIDLTNPPVPENPVITFIVNIAPVPDDAAHFTLETNSSHQLQQLPVLEGIGGTSGWRLEDGTTSVTESEVYNSSTNLYVNIAQTHLITFDWNNAKDGGTSATTTVRTNEAGQIEADKWPDDLAKEKNPGYYFDNWYTEKDGGTVVPKLTTFTGPTTIYAHWKGPFTITFDANGGKFPDGETTKGVETDDDGNLDPAKVAAAVPDPTREGYTKFGGWSLTKDGTEAVEPDAQPYTGATTLYAIWGPPYAIAYDAMGGEVTPTDEQKLTTEDGKYPELPVPTHPRDSFGGWYTTKDYQEGTLATAGADCPGAVTLYAKWTREPPYTITFEANQDGATIEDPVSGKPVTSLALKTDDKGVLMQAPPEPTLRGGKFQGWFTKPEEGTGEQVTDAATRTYTDDMTLYAHWDTMEFKITFDFNLSTIMTNPLNVTTYTTTKGKSLSFLPGELPQASSGKYKIENWYRVPNPVSGKDQPVTTSDTFERDTTIYAKWVEADDLPIVFKYPNITFMNEDGTEAMITLEVDKDYKMSAFPEPPYKEGHTFSGWVTRAPDGTETPLTADTLITGSIIAYPKYVQKGYTITFEPGEESELDPIKVTTTSEGRIPDGQIPEPTWEGHTFSGWYTAAEGGTRINRRTVFTQDTTVYAHWDADDPSGPDDPNNPDDPDNPNNPSNPSNPTSPPYTITFNPNGGNLTSASTALTDLNGRLMSLPTPARTGYSFDGWFNGNERVTTATVFSANTTITAQWTTGTGGSGSGSGDVNGYAITVSNTSGGRVSVSTTYAREGDRVTVTVRPYSGYQLDRIDVVNARGNDVALRDQGSNRYVFYMPASRVTVDAVFMELIANNGSGNTGSGNTGSTGTGGNTNTGWNPGGSGTGTVTNPTGGATSGMGIFSQPVLNTVPMPYLDVNTSDWYYSSVDYMWQRQLMGGVSANRFGPQATTSNAMVWTILARLAGVDVTTGASVWYENARSWAVSNRISDGVGPNSPVTREQLATMLWNYKGSPAVGYDIGQFGDRGQISTYQSECALRWAVANNIVTGTGNRLNPRGTATRAEVAAMITRFCQNT